MDGFEAYGPERSPAIEIAASLLQRLYCDRVEHLLAAAQRAGRDVAVTSPRFVERDGRWSLTWERMVLEPGGWPEADGRVWHVYRCSGGG